MTGETGLRAIRGILSLTSSTLVHMALAFLSVTISVRIISEENYGVYSLMLAIVYLLEVFGSLGLGLSAAKFVAAAADRRERASIVSNLLTFRLITVVVVVGLAIVGRRALLYLYPSELLASLFLYAPILFAAQLTNATLGYIMQGFHLYRKMAYVQVLTGFLNLALVLLLLIGLELDVLSLILANIISLSVACVIRLRLIPVPVRPAFDRRLMRRVLGFGLPLQGNDLLTFLFQRVDVLILGALVGPAHIAYLDIAGKLPGYFRRLYQALNAVYFPSMAELFGQKRQSSAEDLLNSFLRLVSFVTMLGALVCFLFQRELVVLLFSEKYLPSAPALGLLMVVVSISLVNQMLDTGFVAAGRPAYLLIVNVVTAAVSLAANFSLIPLLGFMGAAWARLAANVASNPVSWWCLRREKIKVRVGEYLKPALFFGLSLGIHLVLGQDTLLMRALLVVLYLALSVAFSVVKGQDIAILVASLRLRKSGKTSEVLEG